MSSPFDDPCLKWVKSSHSIPDNNECVEIAVCDHSAGIRDTKNRRRGAVVVEKRDLRGLVRQIKARNTDL